MIVLNNYVQLLNLFKTDVERVENERRDAMANDRFVPPVPRMGTNVLDMRMEGRANGNVEDRR